MWYEQTLAKGLLPDSVLRACIRYLCAKRLKSLQNNQSSEQSMEQFFELQKKLNQSKLAVQTDKANEQHYEVPAQFYQYALGKHLKYSSAYWPDGCTSLDEAEEHMLKLYLQRAELKDGQDILELGCGWGSLTLFMAKNLPNAQITTLSNSHSQREYIEGQLQKHGLNNVRVLTDDINQFDIDQSFDRVVSIEMFEHLRNYQKLFQKIHGFLKDQGKLFVHIFTHKDRPYLFEDKDSYDWMARHFFSGGIMPSNHLFLYNCAPLAIERQWLVNGKHYEKTSNAWLERMDQNAAEVHKLFEQVYGQEAKRYFHFWRVFFMAVAELFGYEGGEQWMVSHYLFTKNV